MEVQKHETTKKAFTTPELIEHGTVEDITGSEVHMGSPFDDPN